MTRPVLGEENIEEFPKNSQKEWSGRNDEVRVTYGRCCQTTSTVPSCSSRVGGPVSINVTSQCVPGCLQVAVFTIKFGPGQARPG